MKIMTDILHHYISDLSITSKKYAEHAYNDVPDIEDVEKAFRQKSVSLTELRRYVRSTGPVKFPHNLPLLNISGKNGLNILKPGSREVLTRPIHIHEHLPTLYTEQIEEELTTDTEQSQKSIENIKQEPEEVILHKRLREISSVVMTSGGFLSPSREGRLADSKLLPFPEIKIEKPLEPSKLSVILPNLDKEPSQKILKKKTKSGIKKKPKGSKKQNVLLQLKEQKQEALKKKKKPKEQKIIIPELPPIPEPVVEEIVDIVNVTEKVQVPKKVIHTSLTSKVKMEEVLPKFSFFGPLPPGPGLIPTAFSHIINPLINLSQPNTIEKPASPVLQVENENINRKEQKKKKKDKKKEKKEKKKQKDKVKEKVKEKEKEKDKKKLKLKSTNKVPKLKFRFGSRLETTTKVLPVEKPPETKITIVPEPEPMEVEMDIESKSDISVNILHNVDSPPKIPIQKIKTKIVVKPIQPAVVPPVIETPPPAFYFDDAGNQVWICPMCTKPDDGSPMIGCDGCDVWYHWVCVGIQCPPDCAVWFCPRCLAKRAQQPKGKRGRPRKNKC